MDYTSQVETNILDAFEGKTVEYVVIPGLGEESDFEGLDLANKVALIKRGTLNFDENAASAAAKGVVAAIIHNNGDDGLYYAALQTHSIPVITIAKDGAEQMIAAQDKHIRFSAEYYGVATNPAGGQLYEEDGKVYLTCLGGTMSIIGTSPLCLSPTVSPRLARALSGSVAALPVCSCLTVLSGSTPTDPMA